jgi:hypothetical protein
MENIDKIRKKIREEIREEISNIEESDLIYKSKDSWNDAKKKNQNRRF